MAKKDRFPPEHDTQPALRRAGTPTTKMPRASGPAPTNRALAPDAPTEPPPRSKRQKPAQRTSKPESARTSGVKSGRPGRAGPGGATVDEVVADLSRDPRREDDD